MSNEFETYKNWVVEMESMYAGYALKSVEVRFLDGSTFDEYYSGLFRGTDIFTQQRNRYRTPFQLERDRILHSPLFQRLARKTQLFTSQRRHLTENRLTHTLKVAQISRSIARGLRLNEDLVEAIALGHDVGHAPFAHIGEIALNEWLGDKVAPEEEQQPPLEGIDQASLPVIQQRMSTEYWDKAMTYFIFGNDPYERLFMHGRQAFKLLVFKQKYEPRNYLRFSKVVMYGIWRHSVENFKTDNEFHFSKRIGDKEIRLDGKEDLTLEAQVVRFADDIAWVISDLAEGLHTGIIKRRNVRKLADDIENATLADRLLAVLEPPFSRLDELYTVFMSDLIERNRQQLTQASSPRSVRIQFSSDIKEVLDKIGNIIHEELHNKYYVARGSRINKGRVKALCDWYFDHPDEYLRELASLRSSPSFPLQIPREKKCVEHLDFQLYEDLIKKDRLYRLSTIVDLVSSLTDEEIYGLSETMPI